MNNVAPFLLLPGGIRTPFRWVPPGAFRMGSRGYFHDEEPLHEVRIERGFWLGETPVTQGQYEVWTKAEEIEHKNRFTGHPDHPAESMTWRDAIRYCAWLTREAGERFEMFPGGVTRACLPTEAEWEYACRAGTETEYHTGDGEGALAEAGWYEGNSGNTTKPVRLKTPNAWGLYDMHGNVFEWCHDVWDEGAYRERVNGEADPGWEARRLDWEAGLEAMLALDQARVLRGGSWDFSARGCRSAFRCWWWPVGSFRDRGFRVCLVPGPSAGGTDEKSERERRRSPHAETKAEGRGRSRSDADGAAADVGELGKASFPRRGR